MVKSKQAYSNILWLAICNNISPNREDFVKIVWNSKKFDIALLGEKRANKSHYNVQVEIQS